MLRFSFFFIVALTLAVSLPAAEIRFADRPVTVGREIVLLGDIAEIEARGDDDLVSLRETILFPTPVAGGERRMKLAQLRDLLGDLGIRGTRHLIDGPQEIVVVGATKSAVTFASASPRKTADTAITPAVATAPAPAAPKANPLRDIRTAPLSKREERQLETQVTAAVKTYLNRCVSDDPNAPASHPWLIEFSLSPAQYRSLGANGEIVNIFGGKNPIVGPQRFEIEMSRLDPETNRPILVTIDAQVDLAVDALVARRSIAKGELITTADLVPAPQNPAALSGIEYYRDPSLVAGKEAAKAIREKVVVTPDMLRSAILVRKGENILVHATSPGITIKTAAKAKQDGAMGDLIIVERLDKDRATFQAIVDGYGRVTVHAASKIVR